MYEDVVNNETLAEQYRQYMLQHLGMTPEQMPTLEESKMSDDQAGSSLVYGLHEHSNKRKLTMESSDFGTCSYLCPGIQAMFSINATNSPHSIEFREAAKGDFAHQEALRAGKANALICLDVLTNDAFARAIKAEFRRAMETAGRWEQNKNTSMNADKCNVSI